VHPLQLADVQPGGVPDEILELVRAGKQLEAIKRYRALNGATLDEARAFIATL
jgi:ribosomal protein L7/L12